jgi:hypothetical protein
LSVEKFGPVTNAVAGFSGVDHTTSNHKRIIARVKSFPIP